MIMEKYYKVFTYPALLFGAFSLMMTLTGDTSWDMVYFAIVLIILGGGFEMSVFFKERRLRAQDKIKKTWQSVEFHNLISGMAKLEGKINLFDLSFQSGRDFDELRFQMYELLGANKISGYFKDHNFIPDGDINASILNLVSEFLTWS